MAHTSTTATCPHCGTPVKDTSLCPDAEQTLHALLRRLVSTVPSTLRLANGTHITDRAGRQPSSRWDTPAGEQGAMPRLLDEAVGRQAKFAPQAEKVNTGKAAARIMLPSKAGDRATRLHAVVVQAANDLISAQMCVMALPLAVETATAAEWLLDGFARLRLHPDAPTLLAELQRAVDGAEKAIDRPADRHYLGPCNLGGATDCTGHMVAVGARPARCDTCRREVDQDDRRRDLLDQAADMWLTSREIERVTASLGRRIPESSVREWAAKGHVQHASTGPVRYLLDDALARAEKVRQRCPRRKTA